MKVTLRKRNKSGKISLYLDFYHIGKRKYEYLRLYLKEKPRTAEDRSSNKKTLELAENIRAKRQLEIQNNIYGFNDSERANSDFIAYFELLAEKRKASEGNYGNWNSVLKHLKEFKKSKVPFSDITPDWLEDFKSFLIHDLKSKNGRKLSQNSCYSYFNKVKAALKQAVKDGYINSNPAAKVDGIREAETSREFLTLDELKKALNTRSDAPVYKNAFIFSCLTGLRYSDIKKLTWQEIQHSKESGYYIRFKQKKTKSFETLPISDEARKMLGEERTTNESVFLDLAYSDFNNQKLREWMIRAGIEKHITFHCARHTYATLQLSLGTDIYTVSKLLGHKNLKTTEVYAKIIDEKKQEAASKINIGL